jgi:hypothetical protein
MQNPRKLPTEARGTNPHRCRFAAARDETHPVAMMNIANVFPYAL